MCTCKSRSEKRRSCEATGEENMGGKKKARIGKGEINWGGGIIAKVVSKEEEEGHKRHDPEAYCVVVVEHTTIPRNQVAADLLAQSFLPPSDPSPCLRPRAAADYFPIFHGKKIRGRKPIFSCCDHCFCKAIKTITTAKAYC